MDNIEIYKFNRSIYFIDNDNGVEGSIIVGYGNHGGEIYAYVSHVEFVDDSDDDVWALDEDYTNYFDKNIELVLNAKEL
jgi:hypothetical protein